MTNVNTDLAEEVISQKKAQGQNIAILSAHKICVIFGSASNVDARYGPKGPSRNRSADKIYRAENLEQIKIDQPGFLIILSDEEKLL